MRRMPKPARKRTMTLNLSEAEMTVLDELATEKGLNKTAVLRQALRLYQEIDSRVRGGEKIVLEDKLTKAKSELVVL